MIKYGNILQNINRFYIKMVVKIYSYLTTIKQYKILIDYPSDSCRILKLFWKPTLLFVLYSNVF